MGLAPVLLANTAPYQVRYQASLLYLESHTYVADYVMQTLISIRIQIKLYGKPFLRLS